MSILVELGNSSCNLVGSSGDRLTCKWYDFIKTKFKEILRERKDLAQGQVQ